MKRVNEENSQYLEVKKISDAICEKVLNANNENDEMIDEWFAKNRQAISVIEKFADEENLNNRCQEYKEISIDKKEDVERLVHLLSRKQKRRNVRSRFILKLSSAAAAAIILFVLLFNSEQPALQKSEDVIRKPTLLVGNGASVDLAAIDERKVEIGKLNKSTVSNVVEYNTIVIPQKYTYTVILEDSTEVFLNAGSRLKYPTHFNEKRREVHLTGEAYFKVTKSKIPFVVKTNDIAVRVYGTEFNVNTKKESGVEAVLVKGSVGVSLNDTLNPQEVLMKPNQLVKLDAKTKALKLENIDTDIYLAWRRNYISYDKEPLGNVLSEIAAWYGLKFTYKNEENKMINVWISVSRDRKVEEILSTIEGMTELKFIKEGGDTYVVE